MAAINDDLVKTIVNRVLSELNNRSIAPGPGPTDGIFDDVDQAVQATAKAQKIWAKSSLSSRKKVIDALRQAMHDHAEEFSKRAQQETGMGRVADKILKHHNAAIATPGIEDLTSQSWSGDHGLAVEEYAPYGVVAAITPSTHPIPVLLNSIIIITAPGNGAVFNVHPAAKKVSAYAMGIFSKAIQSAGGPPNLVTMLREPTLETVDQLFNHPLIPLIAATGGPALVEAAFKAGKKVIAAGPGNPPVVVDPTAKIQSAARRIIRGASFDNNILCIAEKEVFVVEPVFEEFMSAMESEGAVRLNAAQIESLTQKVFRKSADNKWLIGRDFIGKNASVLAAAAGLTLPDEVRLLCGETGPEHPFVQEEQMMPFLPVVRCNNVQEAFDRAVQAEHGFGHTAMIYSNDLDNITAFSKVIDTDVLVVNGPSMAGNGWPAGEAYFSHTIASPTGEGVCTPRNFARVRRICTYNSLRSV